MTNQTAKITQLQEQIQKERRLVSFDSYDISVRQLVEMFETDNIKIPPEYQRQFLWDVNRQSQLIESLFLGIPVPSLFMATNNDSTWEIVDGVQRLGTVAHFVGTPSLLTKINRSEPLRITELEKIPAMQGMFYQDLPSTLQLMFGTRPLRVTVLNDKSDSNVRFDLFERLNTGGIILSAQEIRNCVYRGIFNDSIKTLSTTNDFVSVTNLQPADEKNGTREELVLRFFAYLNAYQDFEHSVKGFLNDYMKKNINNAPSNLDIQLFKKTFQYLRKELPNGIARGNRRVTPINLYEAISVGVALCIKSGKAPRKVARLLNDPKLQKLTTGATNSRKMVAGRIEFVRDAL
ncbi:DUF262 domain-containing protein [Corallococcus sp. AS-1-6]|uniref:DUF262 domain-containing protein n=1 Tax=Corallococcus sp. AS-1-6 TaxID=2874599 RepID=UPI001CBF499D|nr:DUF262 domain-containing protein [Corallococcus sp. AS-1-6]MBZ4374610.1 DUF262 domain-containing protein [Corallococcus sp. AS-1-6]